MAIRGTEPRPDESALSVPVGDDCQSMAYRDTDTEKTSRAQPFRRLAAFGEVARVGPTCQSRKRSASQRTPTENPPPPR